VKLGQGSSVSEGCQEFVDRVIDPVPVAALFGMVQNHMVLNLGRVILEYAVTRAEP
jgi:hypothetical protein